MSKLTYAIPFKTAAGRRQCNKRLSGGGKPYLYEDLEFEVNDGEEDGLRTILFQVGDNRPCAIIHFDSTEEAILQVFERGAKCATNRRMNRGKDTRTMLLAIRNRSFIPRNRLRSPRVCECNLTLVFPMALASIQLDPQAIKSGATLFSLRTT